MTVCPLGCLSLSRCLSQSVTLSVSVCQCVFLSLSLFLCLSVCLSLSDCLSQFLSICRNDCMSVRLSVSLCLSRSLSVRDTVCLSVYVCVFLSLSLCSGEHLIRRFSLLCLFPHEEICFSSAGHLNSAQARFHLVPSVIRSIHTKRLSQRWKGWGRAVFFFLGGGGLGGWKRRSPLVNTIAFVQVVPNPWSVHLS